MTTMTGEDTAPRGACNQTRPSGVAGLPKGRGRSRIFADPAHDPEDVAEAQVHGVCQGVARDGRCNAECKG